MISALAFGIEQADESVWLIMLTPVSVWQEYDISDHLDPVSLLPISHSSYLGNTFGSMSLATSH